MSSIASTSSGKSEISEQYASQQAEKEKLRADHEAEMERLKETYSAEKEALKDRFETSTQNERLQSYDNLRNLKKQLTTAEKNLKSAGDERLEQRSAGYQQEETRITKEGTAKVDAALKKQAAIEEYQRNQANTAESTARYAHTHDAQMIIKDSENKLENLRQDKVDFLDKRKAEHGVAVEQIKDHYDQRQTRLLTEHEKETQRIKDGVDQQINDSRLENAKRLEAHMEKQEDPFYEMSYVDSDFSDQGDFYQLKVRLPEYEKKGFRVQVAGQELQLSGMRTSNQKAELEPGHDMSTNSYQSYSERYQFDSPVDAKAMKVTQEDDWLLYTIPKYGPNHRMREESTRSTTSKLALEMSKDVDFKDTLPLPQSVKDKGSKTYS